MEGFDIEFIKLKNGIHNLTFEVKQPFFDFFQNSDILSADVLIALEVSKLDQMMTVDLKGTGTIILTCDRCLEPFPMNIQTDFKVIYHFNALETVKEDTGDLKVDVCYLNAATYKVNLAESIYDSFLPVVPMVKRCDELSNTSCQNNLLQLLDSEDEKDQNDVDPRWDALKKLIDNKE
jgi:uncharacterized protein